MDHARSTFVLPFKTLCVCAASALSACGFGGRVDLGEDGGRPPTTLGGDANQIASGGATSAPAGGQTSVIGSGGSSSGGGPLGGASAAMGGAGTLPTALAMDASGVVPASTNAYGIQAKWYAFSDELDGGQTRIDGYYETMVPFVPGRGMCINGTTQSGLADDWKTWGAGIGIALHVVDEKAETLVNPPACFTLVISSDAAYPMELRADLNPTDDGSVMPPNVPLHPGVNAPEEVDGRLVGRRRPAPQLGAAAEEDDRRLRERLEDERGGHDRHPRKVALEEAFVARDVLLPDDPLARDELRHAIEHEERVGLRQQPADLLEIQDDGIRHAGSPPPKASGP